MTQTCTNSEDQREQLLEDMKQQIRMIEENSKPTKRWWHRFIKPSPPAFLFEIEGRPTFTEEELAERRAFLDGFEAGRKDGDAGPAYKLWRRMKEHSDK